jgi:hypothetical protein
VQALRRLAEGLDALNLGGRASPDFLTGKSPFQAELEHFIECITTWAEPVVGVDGLRELEIVPAAYSSGEHHEPKRVERTEIGA